MEEQLDRGLNSPAIPTRRKYVEACGVGRTVREQHLVGVLRGRDPVCFFSAGRDAADLCEERRVGTTCAIVGDKVNHVDEPVLALCRREDSRTGRGDIEPCEVTVDRKA